MGYFIWLKNNNINYLDFSENFLFSVPCHPCGASNTTTAVQCKTPKYTECNRNCINKWEGGDVEGKPIFTNSSKGTELHISPTLVIYSLIIAISSLRRCESLNAIDYNRNWMCIASGSIRGKLGMLYWLKICRLDHLILCSSPLIYSKI